jgi:RNA polymerase sigma factor (sigma-70 family)
VTDHEGFEAWYSQEYSRLVVALGLVARDRQEAEEAAAEAFARCLERWGTPDQPRNPSAWTYTVGVNLLRRRWKRRRREAEHLAAQVVPRGVETEAPALELWSAVAALPPRERVAVVLRYIGGLTEQEIADAMDIKPGTVATSLSRARTKLAAQLRGQGLDPAFERDLAHE